MSDPQPALLIQSENRQLSLPLALSSDFVVGIMVTRTALATWRPSKPKATVWVPVGHRNSGLNAAIKEEFTPSCINKTGDVGTNWLRRKKKLVPCEHKPTGEQVPVSSTSFSFILTNPLSSGKTSLSHLFHSLLRIATWENNVVSCFVLAAADTLSSFFQ